MNKKSRKQGITLIALIITIIVLLILAGVTMSFVVGDNGVLTQAQKAKIRTDKESAEEEVKLEVVGSYDDNGNLDLDLLGKNLKANLPGIKIKVRKENSEEYEYQELKEDSIKCLPVTVYYKQNEVKINEKQLISDVAKYPENYGMYVDYPIDLSGDGDTTNDWKIFYEDETGRVFLIAADYVPSTCKYLKKDDDSENLICEMAKSSSTGKDKCCLYWASVPEYECYDGHNELNKEKKQCSFPEIFMLGREDNKDEHTNNHYYCSDHVSHDMFVGWSNSGCASSLQCTGAWNKFVDERYAEYAIGGSTIEMWVASWNQKHGKIESEESSEGITLFANGNNTSSKNGYYVGDTKDCMTTAKSIRSCNEGYKDTLYFPHQSSKNLNLFEEKINESSNQETKNAECKGYWIASPSGYSRSSKELITVTNDGALSSETYEKYYDSAYGIRPIVLLNSGLYVEVEEEEIKKDEDDNISVIKSCTLVK